MDFSTKYLKNLYNELSKGEQPNGELDLKKLDLSSIAMLVALLLNEEITLFEEQEIRSFAADDIVPVKIRISENEIEYWGLIYWLSKPKTHKCFKSHRDPFYGLFKIKNEMLVIKQLLWGDYLAQDLDTETWINNEIEWMYQVEYD